jgi:hypothetical protein
MLLLALLNRLFCAMHPLRQESDLILLRDDLHLLD